ncbi:MAG: radical SAM protein [Candidatus Omnitrophica bacterium]|nr:radical SAM protein [Candidatus Omnitrophota bacterium]
MGIKVAFVTGPEENLGIKYLSAVLRGQGHKIRLFCDPQLFNDEILSIKPLSWVFDSKNRLVADLLNYEPDLIGFSVCTDFSSWAYDLAVKIKEKTNIPIIFGGIHPTSVPDEVMSLEAVDMACIGEGEYPLLELADSLSKGQVDCNIKNIWFRKDGRIIKNPVRQLVDINNLPFPDHELYCSRKNAYFRIGYHTSASRGCPYNCSYCCHSILKNLYGQANYYRIRNPINLIKELSIALERYRFKVVRFHDDVFPCDVQWLEEFADSYRKNVFVPFICYLHPELVNEDRIALLKKAGCSEIRLGIQTLNHKIRKEILNRHESNEVIEKSLDLIRGNGIKAVTENMLGLPKQNDSDIISMIHFYNKNRVTRSHYFWLRYYPGLGIQKHKDSSGLSFHKEKYGKVFTQGGDTYKDTNPKLITTLYILPFLPRWLVEFIINKKIWRFLPGFIPLWSLNLIANVTSNSSSDRIWRARTIRRYLFPVINVNK